MRDKAERQRTTTYFPHLMITRVFSYSNALVVKALVQTLPFKSMTDKEQTKNIEFFHPGGVQNQPD